MTENFSDLDDFYINLGDHVKLSQKHGKTYSGRNSSFHFYLYGPLICELRSRYANIMHILQSLKSTILNACIDVGKGIFIFCRRKLQKHFKQQSKYPRGAAVE